MESNRISQCYNINLVGHTDEGHPSKWEDSLQIRMDQMITIKVNNMFLYKRYDEYGEWRQ